MVRIDLLGHDMEVTETAYGYLHAWLDAVPQMGLQIRVFNDENGTWSKSVPPIPERRVSIFPPPPRSAPEPEPEPVKK